MLIYLLYKGNCRQFDLTLARMLSIVTKVLNVTQRNQYRGKIVKRESCGTNNFLQDQGSKFPSLLGSGIKILSENMGSIMKKIYLVTTLILTSTATFMRQITSINFSKPVLIWQNFLQGKTPLSPSWLFDNFHEFQRLVFRNREKLKS